MVVILLPLTVSYKNSSGFSRTNFSVKQRPFLYLLTLVSDKNNFKVGFPY